MIAKLRLKFIAISTVAVTLVIVALLGLVNSVMYHKTLDSVYQTAAFIAENDGKMPSDRKKMKQDFTDDDMYRVRYFSVQLDSENKTVSSNLGRIAAVDENELEFFVNEVCSRDFKRGHFTYDNCEYAYTVKDTNSGRVIVFLDCTNEVKTTDDFREMSMLFGLVCLLVFVIIVSIYSRRAIAPVIRNMESQKQFITNASHELKTPLAVISANTEVIEMSNGESEWTRSIISQVNRLNTLIGELITISKFGEKDKKELTQVNASKIVSDCADDFKTVITQQGKEFTADIAENVTVKAADEGIRQIAGILLDNAAKYCDDGGKVSLALAHKSGSKGMRLTVSNTYRDGKDIDVNRFFERFYRSDESHNSEKSGYGIGLAMAQGYAEEFGGKIAVAYKDSTISFIVSI
ncbi:MAG: HAMP domain-containing histidine kinase [Eubacterium sp.]|nr:HAMP domain-containing histidine kinase [Eubacterium sp.]